MLFMLRFPIFKCHVLTCLIEVYSGAYLAHPFLPIFLEQRDWRLNRTKDEVTAWNTNWRLGASAYFWDQTYRDLIWDMSGRCHEDSFGTVTTPAKNTWGLVDWWWGEMPGFNEWHDLPTIGVQCHRVRPDLAVPKGFLLEGIVEKGKDNLRICFIMFFYVWNDLCVWYIGW